MFVLGVAWLGISRAAGLGRRMKIIVAKGDWDERHVDGGLRVAAL